jgi:chorismate lyase/3-hydroxybenzoate synthase
MAQAETRVTAAAGGDRWAVDVEPPGWVLEMVPASLAPWREVTQGLAVRELEGTSARLVSARVRDLLAEDADGAERRTREAYAAVAARVDGCPAPHPVRVWNFIPGILAPLGSLEHRYMAFNAGRFLAYERWFAGRQGFARTVPTASGVGHDGTDLLVHCLTSATPGVPVENPRQVPSYCYSAAYGPLPPCFARATVLEPAGTGAARLLVGGTAAVRGEDSVHAGDLEAQAEETFVNLAELVRTALVGRGLGLECPSRERLLGCYRALRVYYRRGPDRAAVEGLARAAFAAARDIELRRADLCRDPLLVEIEGVADLEP